MANVADARGTELVLEAGVLDPLKWFSTAKRFRLSFASLRWNERFRPKSEHLEIVRGLKDMVEGGFVAGHGTA